VRFSVPGHGEKVIHSEINGVALDLKALLLLFLIALLPLGVGTHVLVIG
jgi:hypothetical protein